MNEQMLQAIIQQLLSGGASQANSQQTNIPQMNAPQMEGSDLGGIGPSGFSEDPNQEIAQLGQVGQSLQFPNELSPTGMNPGFQQNAQMFQNKSPMPGVQQPLQPGHVNAINSGQGHSSMMSPPTPQSIAQYLNQPQGMA